MSNQVTGNPAIATNPAVEYKRNWASGFRRLQLALGGWGVLLMAAGWLHENYGTPWGTILTLVMWLVITAVGYLGTYLLAPAFVNSGVAFMWGAPIVLGFFVTWLVIYPFDGGPWPALSVVWHLAFALGYFLNGYFSDRRLWWLTGWEALMALLMVYVAYNPSPDPSNPLSIGAHPIILGSFDFYSSEGLLLGLTSGIPLLIAALPFWKETYCRG